MPRAVVAIVLVLVALGLISRMLPVEKRAEAASMLVGIAAVLGVYLASLLVVDAAGAHPHHTTQTSQLALSAFWAVLGFGSLVAGLVRASHEHACGSAGEGREGA